jgi:hypothetical protein
MMYTTYRGHNVDVDEASGLYVVQPYGIYVDDYRTWIDAHIAREQDDPTRLNPLVKFKTKSGKAISFNSRGHRKNPVDELCDILEIEALENPKRRRKPAAKKKPAARKPAARKPAAARRSSKDKASYTYYVVFRGPPSGLNIHAGFATQKAARAFITSKFRGTKRLQVRGRAGLEKSGHDPKSAKNWKTFSLAASLKAAPAPRKRTPAKAAAKTKLTARSVSKLGAKQVVALAVPRPTSAKLMAFYRDIKEMGAEALAERGIKPATDAFALKVRAALEDAMDKADGISRRKKPAGVSASGKPSKRSTRKPAARKSTARSRTRRNGSDCGPRIRSPLYLEAIADAREPSTLSDGRLRGCQRVLGLAEKETYSNYMTWEEREGGASFNTKIAYLDLQQILDSRRALAVELKKRGLSPDGE